MLRCGILEVQAKDCGPFGEFSEYTSRAGIDLTGGPGKIGATEVPGETASAAMGMRPCSVPWSSEYWPWKTPSYWMKALIRLMSPGVASVLIPSAGTKKQCSTSCPVARKRM